MVAIAGTVIVALLLSVTWFTPIGISTSLSSNVSLGWEGGISIVPSNSSASIASSVSWLVAGFVIVFCARDIFVSVEVLGVLSGIRSLLRTGLGTLEGFVAKSVFLYLSAAILLFEGFRFRSSSRFLFGGDGGRSANCSKNFL